MVDRGRVGERAKEALVDGLNGFSYDTSLGVVFLPVYQHLCFAGEWGWDGMRWRVGLSGKGN